MPGIRKKPRPRTEAEKALAKELAGHQHYPNLWIHVMDQSEYEAVLRCVDALQFPSKLICTETIHVEADNSDRITMIFEKPEPFEKANYRKWDEIKVALYYRRKKLKEAEEMRGMIAARYPKMIFDSMNIHEFNAYMNGIIKDVNENPEKYLEKGGQVNMHKVFEGTGLKWEYGEKTKLSDI